MRGLIITVLIFMVGFSLGGTVATYDLRSSMSNHWRNASLITNCSCPAVETVTSWVSASSSTPMTTTAPVTSPSLSRHHVTVGAAGTLIFKPDQIEANIGDIVQFDFLALNHTLTQSTLQDPCSSNGILDTGFNQFNPKNITGKYLIEYQVDTVAPQWFFCAQTIKKSHCEAGMVFAINAADSMSDFLAFATGMSLSSSSSNSRADMPISITAEISKITTSWDESLTLSTTRSYQNASRTQSAATPLATPTISGARELGISVAFVLFYIILSEATKLVFLGW